MSTGPPIVVVTPSASPYQVEFFDAVHAVRECELTVVYLHADDRARGRKARPRAHRSIMLGAAANAVQESRDAIAAAELVVFNGYAHLRAGQWMRERDASGRPWCLWGERPGGRLHPAVGKWVRRWLLATLHKRPVPIWGVGSRAVEAYQREFGACRLYCNVPYYSNLRRFDRGFRRGRVQPGLTTFLYSGTLSHRKGVDVLANAFVRLAAEVPNVRLRLLGDGPWRRKVGDLLSTVADLVEFVGFRDWDDLPAEYGRADILCVPSRHDAWGMAVPEGMAAGLPVIATRETGAAVDLVESGQNGWLIPAADPQLLFETMRAAARISDGELAMASAAAMTRVDRHSLAAGAANFLRSAELVVEAQQREAAERRAERL